LLAPLADIYDATGVMNGQIFAQSFSGNYFQCMQQNWEPFEGCIPDFCDNLEPLPYCTSPQQQWALTCAEDFTSMGCVAEEHFFDCFSYDGITVGCVKDPTGHYLTISSVGALRNFLPQSQTSAITPLSQDLLNPTTTEAGAAAAELVTLALAAGFDTCGHDTLGLCSTLTQLYICDTIQGSCATFTNATIGDVLELSNQVIGGCQQTGYTIQQVYKCLVAINNVFSGCQTVTPPISYCQCGQTECDKTPAALLPPINSNASTPPPISSHSSKTNLSVLFISFLISLSFVSL